MDKPTANDLGLNYYLRLRHHNNRPIVEVLVDAVVRLLDFLLVFLALSLG